MTQSLKVYDYWVLEIIEAIFGYLQCLSDFCNGAIWILGGKNIILLLVAICNEGDKILKLLKVLRLLIVQLLRVESSLRLILLEKHVA